MGKRVALEDTTGWGGHVGNVTDEPSDAKM